TVGLMVLFDLSLDMLSGIMPIILLAMGSADGIHLMKRYYERRGRDEDPKSAVRETFSEMGIPIVLTTITTIVGFSSLVISRFSVIRQFGLVTALGVFLALVVTLAFLPAVLAFSKERPWRPARTLPKGSRKFTEALGELVYRRKKLIVIVAGLIVILAAVAIPRIKRNIDWALCLKKGSDPYHAEMLLREKFGGSTPIQILVKGDIKNPATLKEARYLEKYLETLPHGSNFQSIADVVAEMNEVMTDRYRIPESKEGVGNLWFFIEDKEITKQLVAIEDTEALVQGRLRGTRTKEFAETTADIEKFLKRLPQSIAIVDLRQSSPELRKALFQLRLREVTDKILWDLKKRGVEVDRKEIEASIRSALMDKGWLQRASSFIQKNVAEYLLSPESEVKFNSPDAVESIVRTLGERIRKRGEISTAEIATLVRSKVKGVSNEDVQFLSQSLKWLIRESIGEARVDWMLRLIVKVLPQPFDSDNNLFRELKGDLWDVNDNFISLNWQKYKRLSTQEDLPPVKQLRVAFYHSGLVPIFDRMEKELMPTQIETLLMALVAVILLLALIHRSFVGGLIAVVPISLTILLNFAVMGYLKIDLDSWTAMIASIAIGLGIDTDIHFISRFKKELTLNGSYLEALKRTLSTTGVSIVINALAVGLGFMVLLFASGQHLRRIGGLVALTILLSALFTLTILPSILLWVRPRFLRRFYEHERTKANCRLQEPLHSTEL
ncbi:MAG: RND family transporter, partial [bacterium]